MISLLGPLRLWSKRHKSDESPSHQKLQAGRRNIFASSRTCSKHPHWETRAAAARRKKAAFSIMGLRHIPNLAGPPPKPPTSHKTKNKRDALGRFAAWSVGAFRAPLELLGCTACSDAQRPQQRVDLRARVSPPFPVPEVVCGIFCCQHLIQHTIWIPRPLLQSSCVEFCVFGCVAWEGFKTRLERAHPHGQNA